MYVSGTGGALREPVHGTWVAAKGLKGGGMVFGYFRAVFLLKIGHYGERSMIRTKDHLFPFPYL